MSSETQTTCPYCGVGCGIIASVDEVGHVDVRGDPARPSNQGFLCSKGLALADTLGIEGRLLYPEVNGTTLSWDDALNYTAQTFQKIMREHGRESIAFYVSGQLLTEDYYVANKLMKGFIGTANIDTNSRLCMSSAVAAHKRAFGADAVPCTYEDIDRAKLIVLLGSNTAWCHPVLYQRIVRAKKTNPDLMVVVIDPRKTATCDGADLHLAIRPGTDHCLFSGLLVYLDAHDEQHIMFTSQSVEGLEETLAAAKAFVPTIGHVASMCGLPETEVQQFFRLFSRTERVVSIFSQGINQWSYGTDNIQSLINCHLFTGRIGRPGMGPFSVTGQPNAMGGREVGGLCNQLAAHMDLENPQHRDTVQTFWDSPYIADSPGPKAVEMFDQIAAGKIRAIWIMATNPAVSMPDADRVRAALDQCEFVVVSDCIRETDTTGYANVLFPAQTWGERDGTVTNSERRIARQKAFLSSPGQARSDWWIVSQIAARLGYADAFSYQEAADIFREHAALSGFRNDGQRAFDISALADISYTDYDNLDARQWPMPSGNPGGTQRLFTDGRFFTPSAKARMVAVAFHQPAHSLDPDFPLTLNTGRIRDHWHTMTRTGKSARLSGHIYEPFATLHPSDANQYAAEDKKLIRVTSRWGSIVVRANVCGTQQIGSVFVPIHWNNQFSSKAYADALVNPATDPISGQPEFKHTPATIEPYRASWYGFLLSRRRLHIENASYWSCSRGHGLWRYELAGDEDPRDWADCARLLLCQHAEEVNWIEYHDQSANCYRAARIANDRLESCVFFGPDIDLPERDWLLGLFAHDTLKPEDRRNILMGNPPNAQHDAGRIVCACMETGLNVLVNTIRAQHLTTPEAVGETLHAGTSCGSCVPEIRKIIAQTLDDII
ncbi:MAG TPA: nitrate reductase [Chromatiaceae bacterium]|jgi:assimilatory nitrate reductase catalytic subunit|nr:nitrate reductase [Chromatiaceae bacterium]HIA09433.1 nitrate reductase [Chromatiaceae bacterium]HIB83610.1 nitrate reductase [Chromatiaceae bacterium]HIN82875.1 nitrate reductase [Chromatiales bacterium]HIO54146.1 nitrate reductase [Chromatiales bacterium]